jgi:predicted lipid-binding transport protein (Tim44 family)
MALEFVALDSTEIVDREFDDTTATIRVKFKSELFLSEGQTDDKEAAAATLLRAIDIWTFRRKHSSASPVWMLAATDSE